jgi:tetratricopeptide (TPR) repeat protein
LEKRITEIERPVWQLNDQHRSVVRPTADGGDHVALGPNGAEDATLPRGVFERIDKTRVKSDLVYYAEAFASIKSRNFAAARALLEEASTLYSLQNESLGYLLPLYAYAAARTGDTTSVNKLLETFPRQYQRFDYYLARGTIAAMIGDAEQAIRYLTLALHRRPFTNRRPVYTEYQYGEICEWLFEATRDQRYRKLALDWAQKNQTIQPWFAWPYAMQARLETDPAKRSRAIAMTYYLDPKSERLGALPKAEVAKAVREYGDRNPFKRAVDNVPKRPI